MQDKVFCSVAQGKVVGGQLGILCIKGSLVTSQPTFITQNGRGIDQGTLQVNIDIRVNFHIFMTVGGLEFAGLVARLWSECTLKGQFQTFEQFVLHGHLSVEGIVCVPFFGQGQAVVANLVFGFQRTEYFTGILIGLTICAELNAGSGLGFAVQLPQTEVIAFAKDITSLFTQIGI